MNNLPIKRRDWSRFAPDTYDTLLTATDRLRAKLDCVPETIKEYEAHLFSVVSLCLAHGKDPEDIVELFMVAGPDVEPPPFVAAMRLHRADQLEAGLRRAIQQVQMHHAGSAAKVDAEAWYVARNWPDWRQGAALRIQVAGLYQTWMVGKRSFTKSDRDFAHLASIGTVNHSDTKTFRRARGYLQKLGAMDWRPSGKGNPLMANTLYTVHHADGPRGWLKPRNTNAPTIITSPSVVDSNGGVCIAPSPTDLLHPAFDRAGAGLGVAAGVLWTLLRTEGPKRAPELATKLGMTPDGVRKALRRMEDVGMVEHEDGAWSAVDTDLDLLAVELGVADHRERRAIAHDRQRQGYQAYRLANPHKAEQIDRRRAQEREQRELERGE